MIKNRRLLIFSALLVVTLLIMWSIFISHENTNKKVAPTPKISVTPTITLQPTEQPNDGTVGSLPESVAPDFKLKNLEGQIVRLSDYKSKLVLLNFWETWDPSSKDQLSILNAVNNELVPEDDTVILAVTDQSSDQVKKFIKENKYDVDVLNDKDQKVFESYNVRQIPTTYIIDKDGIIKDSKTSVMSKEEVFDVINKYNK